MINILIPMGGNNKFESERYFYPKPLIEISGKLMIELVTDFLGQINKQKKYVFVVNKSDCVDYHLDDVLNLITNDNGVVIKQNKSEYGAICSALLAVDHIDNDTPLIISSSDHYIHYDMDKIIEEFQTKDLDAATICFRGVHPKWSYVRLDGNDQIVEAAEKRPISKHAVAGILYFKKGRDFVKAAKDVIRKNNNLDGRFYLSSALNEMVLMNKKMGIYKIPASKYHNFYSSHKISEFEMECKNIIGVPDED